MEIVPEKNCLKCEKTFKNRSNLKRHIKLVHPEDVDYLKSFPRRTRPIKPNASNSCSESLKKCLKCESTFVSLANLKRHIKSFHPEHVDYLKSLPTRPIASSSCPESLKKCLKCGNAFVNLANLKRHIKSVHPEHVDYLKSFPTKPIASNSCSKSLKKCMKCGKTFVNLSNLKRHVKLIHPEHVDYLKSLLPRLKASNSRLKSLKRCMKCGKAFNMLSNLKIHVKMCHPEQTDYVKYLQKRLNAESSKNCIKCGKTFKNLSNLKRHVKLTHPEHVDYLTTLQKSYQYSCSECSRNFSLFKNFKYHVKRHTFHSANNEIGQKQPPKKQKCAMCDYISDRNNLIDHYAESHDVVVQKKTLTFDTIDDFNSWKNTFEQQTCSKFVREYETSVGSKSFICHRSGTYVPRGGGLRHLKKQGSKKINAFCPARIKVKKAGGEYIAEIVEPHVGHFNEIEHLTLTKSEREALAIEIASKTCFDDILDNVRDSICASDLKRLHLLTRKDLHNIEQSYNLWSVKGRHPDDTVTVESWVNQMQHKTDAVLFYKSKGCLSYDWPSLNEDDFVLIIMSAAQCEMLRKYGSDCICIDVTDAISNDDFQLLTLLVVDDIQQGFPCSFLISNRSDEEVLKLFFYYVKTQLESEIFPQVFMSDVADYFYSAWLEIMTLPKFRLYCTWHVDQDWRKNIKRIGTKKKQIAVYKNLRTLLEEQDEETFNTKNEHFYETFSQDPDTVDFANYYKDNYMNNAFCWAYCYRLEAGLKTNMHLERMHKTLKQIYVKGQKVKRLDKAINAIMHLVRDKYVDRLVLNKGKLIQKLELIRARHESSSSLDVNLVVPYSTIGWNVSSTETNELYLIQKMKEICDCELRCLECRSCLHQYSCSCIDSSIRYNMCKHIHLVCLYLQEQDRSSPDCVITEYEDDTETQGHLSDTSSKSSSSICMEARKRKMIETLKEITEKVHIMNSDELSVLEKCLSSMSFTKLNLIVS